MKPLKTILHPTDLSDNSRYALELASMMAHDQKARLLILHVVPKVMPVTGGGDVPALQRAEKYQQELKTYQDEMRSRLNHLKAPDAKVSVERVLREGPVPATIVQTAHQTPCDLIVMGTHGQSKEAKGLMGSVAEEVLRTASCPVVTVKLPGTV
jgi:nucleotide-binding universal stress UspA family protein